MMDGRENIGRKSILKHSHEDKKKSMDKRLKFDEENIKDTLHPENKDYGFMKIPECNTPYERDRSSDVTPVNPEELAKRLAGLEANTEEERRAAEEKRKAFQERKKQHYRNEYKDATKKKYS